MSISSPGIGSGLDVKSIVSQLVALEKAPLTKLNIQQATTETKISTFAQLKGMVSPLSDAASSLNSLTTWNATTATSSNTKAVTASVVGGTAPTNFSVEVQGLAKPQDYASAGVLPLSSAIGAGSISIQLGKWTPPVGLTPASFAPGTAAAVSLTVSATDKLTDIASAINGANAGVTASVLNDASGERLLLRSKNTGEESGFQLTVNDTDGVHTDASGLSRLVAGSSITTYASNAKATINGIPVESSTNVFDNVVSGVTLTAVDVTTSAATVTVGKDFNTIKTAINKFVEAYNAINSNLNDLTKYDPSSGTGALLQGDATAIALQNGLRSLLQSNTVGSAFKRLAEIGVTQQLGGNLSVDSSKLTTALNERFDDVKNLFKIDNSNPATNGIALKMKDFTKGLLDVKGFFSSKEATLKKSLDAIDKDKIRVNQKVSRIEAELNRRYSVLDGKMGQLNALNSYVAQQVTAWNKQGS